MVAPSISVAAIIANLHDVVIILGFFAFFQWEFSLTVLAAILAVLGYSVNESVVIFDRIRENVPLMRRASMRVIGNVSLWEVIPRSLATTFITLLPVASLYLLGGDTLKDFAFALLIGIGAGAYSSIFVAAPMLAMFKEREPEYARRKDEAMDAGSVGGLLREAEELAAAQPTPDLIPDAFQDGGNDSVEEADGVPEPPAAGDAVAVRVDPAGLAVLPAGDRDPGRMGAAGPRPLG